VHVFLIGLEGKRLGLMRELVPQAALMGLLVNPRSPDSEAQSKGLQAAARAIGQQIVVVEAGSGSIGATPSDNAARRAGENG
jgi:ABC-type uncharacterized transport system substrate-binding protein